MQTRLGVYIHIPFCPARCDYCDFLTFPHAEAFHAPYVEALLREMALPQVQEILACHVVDSIYIGGGTPSMLPSSCIGDILDTMREQAHVAHDVEVTLEANPATFAVDDVRRWARAGVNRVSLGVQTFSDGLLQAMGRTHTADEARLAVGLLREGGIANLNIDLMVALPNQTRDDVRFDVAQVRALHPTHVSWYELILEAKTVFGFRAREGTLDLPAEEETVALWEEAARGLSSLGYERYEISNFARAGFASRHNLKYWTGEAYLGLGLGASGYIGGQRHDNTRNISSYIKHVTRGDDPGLCLERTREDDLFEQVMMGLRKIRGINRQRFARKNGCDVVSLAPRTIDREVTHGLMTLDAEHLAFTERGLWIQNDILSDMWLEWDDKARRC